MLKPLSSPVDRVREALRVHGLEAGILSMQASTRTAKEAADAIGCRVEQIAKSLLFKTRVSQKPVLVVASGGNRVNEKVLERILQEPLEKANADFVREKTGFVIGGVSPIAHLETIPTFLDEDLFQYEILWAAAGSEFAVFCLTPLQLEKLSGGKRISIK
jgi:prolyl-tRNA editing enzyme YbaK/EbsC (Cys-tRNA(Pro) deacylase)